MDIHAEPKQKALLSVTTVPPVFRIWPKNELIVLEFYVYNPILFELLAIVFVNIKQKL